MNDCLFINYFFFLYSLFTDLDLPIFITFVFLSSRVEFKLTVKKTLLLTSLLRVVGLDSRLEGFIGKRIFVSVEKKKKKKRDLKE